MAEIVRSRYDYRARFPVRNADAPAFVSRYVYESALQRHKKRIFDAGSKLVAFIEKQYRGRLPRCCIHCLCRKIVRQTDLAEDQELSLPFHLSCLFKELRSLASRK